jgi:hypothetical protein
VWHRRAGKDSVALHWCAYSMMKRPGNYWFMLPHSSQCRKAVWTAINDETNKLLIDEAFPLLLRKRTLENEMMIEFIAPPGADIGSTFQLIGSDNYNHLIGSNPVGLVFSEWATSTPAAWGFLSPIVARNDGWALFNTTPRGTHNHAHRMYQEYRNDPDWFTELLPATKTTVFSPEKLAKEKKNLISTYGWDNGEALYRQEYEVSWSAGFLGSYYNRLMEEADNEGRIKGVPHDPMLPVFTAWDLGVEGTAIWFIQQSGSQIWAIDYIENIDVGMDYFAKALQEGHRARYNYARHIFPHDARHREQTASGARSRLDVLRQLGISKQVVLPSESIADGINAVRMILPRMWFDAEKCGRGLECLRSYSRRWDEDRKVYADKPYHDQYSHGADALRYFAMANVKNPNKQPMPVPRLAIV